MAESVLAIVLLPGVIVFLLACLLDRVFGEPPASLHPVAVFGHLVLVLLRFLPREGRRALIVGGVLGLGLPAAVFLGTDRLLGLLALTPRVQLVLAGVLFSTTFAVRLLDREVAALAAHLEAGDVPAARAHLPRLCSRAPDELDEADLAGAGVASLAENACDSFVAPWFWFVLLGLPGAAAYRTINTLDAMIGYRGEYERLGKVAARLDDVVNWIPARITAACVVLAAPLEGLSARAGLERARRDASRTPSPNGGWPMAAMAGVLGVTLDKPGVYRLNEEGAAPGVGSMHLARSVTGIAATLAGVAALIALVAAAFVRGELG